MLRNYFKIAIRQFLKNKTISLINVLGLSIGMTVFILLFLFIQHEYSYDNFHLRKDNIYSLWNKARWGNKLVCSDVTPRIAATTIRKNVSEIEKTTRVDWARDRLLLVGDKKIMSSGMAVDPEFLEMFNFPLQEGDISSAFKNAHSILLTNKLSKKLFGEENPIGKTLKIHGEELVTVTGILKTPPDNTRFKFDYLLPWKYTEIGNGEDLFWGNNSTQTFVRVNQNVSMAEVQDKIKNLRKNYAPIDTFPMFLYPLEKGHLYSNFENGVETGGKITTVRILCLIAGFILLIGCLNFMNLATARGDKRAKEVGIRKATGAERKSLVFQFISETMLVTVISYLLALIIVIACLPAYNEFTNKQLQLNLNHPYFWFLSIIFVFITAILAGSYPAFFLSSYNPIKALKGNLQTVKEKTAIRKGFVVFQFSFTIILIISALVIQLQISHTMKREQGYNGTNLIFHELNEDLNKNYALLKNELLANNLAQAVSKTSSPVTECWSSSTSLWWNGKDAENKTQINRYCADEDFVKTLGLHLISGRDFDLKHFASDSSAMIINESALKLTGFKNPIGEIIKDGEDSYHIVGVVKDFIIGSPYADVKPMVVFGARLNFFNEIHMRLIPGDNTFKKVEAIVKKHNANYPTNINYANEQYKNKFEELKQVSTISNIFSGISIFIACSGLFGLALLVAQKRIKEIGIRKVLGASIIKITTLLSFDFIKIILLAFIVSLPIAWILVNNWLNDFDYRINMPIWVFILVGITVTVIAMLTISIHAIRAAISNPIKSLRTE